MIFKIIKTTQPKGSCRRCSRPLCSSQSTGGTPIHTPKCAERGPEEQMLTHPVPQDPTACRYDTRNPPRSHHRSDVLRKTLIVRTMSNVPPMSSQRRTDAFDLGSGHPKRCQMLLRKEVIQPHLPVRLPCYDLVLITDPTFDGSLHKG